MRTSTKLAAALVAAAAATTLTACGGNSSDDSGAAASVSAAPRQTIIEPAAPMAKPDLKLTDSHGHPYDLRKETAGHPTLIYFGYTHCPDVCPLTMANLAVAAKKLPASERKDLRVVFVTSDPQRDTPAALKKWLGGIDPDFVGLTGDFSTIQHAAQKVDVSLEKPYRNKKGDIVVTHSAQVLLASPKDDKIHWIGMQDATAERYTKALPRLVKGQKP